MPVLIDLATAPPPYVVRQTTAAAELKQRMGGNPVTNRMIDAAASRSGIETRHVVVADADPAVGKKFYAVTSAGPHPGTAPRMSLYREWSGRLAVEASSALLAKTETPPASIDRLITISCTGFSAPNFDQQIITRLGLPPSVRRTHIGFMGCAAALVGLNNVLEAGQGPGRMILLVALELCSLHVQTEPTRDNILANMLFADGCAAALFSSDPGRAGKARLLSTDSFLLENSEGMMGWEIGDHGFRMALSASLPDVIAGSAIPAARKIFSDRNLSPDRICHWALHPGGRAILDALQHGLELSNAQMTPSRAVLNRYGNMSSASIVYVIKEVLETSSIRPGELLCAVAFGPGLTMEIALFEGV